MANQEHLEILAQGIDTLNKWRKEHPEIQVDLSGANLRNAILNSADLSNANLCKAIIHSADFSRANLRNADLSNVSLQEEGFVNANFSGADLSGANLRNADLSGADLSNADLSSANLRNANLERAILRNADLRGVHLEEAILYGADLSGANLSRVSIVETTIVDADFSGANLSGADLIGAQCWDVDFSAANLSGTLLETASFHSVNVSGANLSNAWIGHTTFEDIDLRDVKGLETVYHANPSAISIDTIYRSGGNIPEAFLLRAGVPDPFIDYMRSLVGKPIDYYTCFISYSSKDQAFAKRLYADLQSNGVRCWFAPEDLKIGAKIRSSIDESIRLHDKLLLVLSKYSVMSQWVEQEVEKALARERKESKVILFPIRLDQSVMDIEEGWPALIRNTRNIGDFSRWKRHETYRKAFDRLLRDLKAEAPKKGG